MPTHVILAGTPVQVRCPDGSTHRHVMRKTLRLYLAGSSFNGAMMDFRHDGHRITVHKDFVDAAYLVPAGVPCKIGRRDDDSDWQPFRTRRVLVFEKPYRQKIGEFLFDHGDWLLWISAAHVHEPHSS